MSLAESGKTLLLGNRVHIGTNEECDNVEEGNPGVLRKELLCKGQRQWRRDPADLHDRHETCFPSRMDLVESLSAGNNGH